MRTQSIVSKAWWLCVCLHCLVGQFQANAFLPPSIPSSNPPSTTLEWKRSSSSSSSRRLVGDRLSTSWRRRPHTGLNAIPGLEHWIADAATTTTTTATTTTLSTTTSLVSQSSPALASLGTWITNLAQQGGPPAMALAVAFSDAVPLVPTQPISVAAGALFGFPTGLLAVVLGQTVATGFALVVGRQLGSSILDLLGRENGEKVKKVLEQLGLDSTADYKQVFTTILVARQSPVLPFSLGNYMVGAATSAPILPALLGTVIGCLPLNCVWVGAGAGGMSALDLLTQQQQGEGGGKSLLPDSPYLSALETVGVLATVLIVANVAKVVWSVWQEDKDTCNSSSPLAPK